MLERLAHEPGLVDLVREQVKMIIWCGTSMDLDTRDLLRTAVLPGIPMYGLCGSTMALSAVFERIGAVTDLCVFDTPSPHMTFTVVEGAY